MDKKNMVSSLTGPRMTYDLYAARLKDFASRMKPNSVAIIVANPERTRSNDTEFEFRQSSDLLYLTGFNEPGGGTLGQQEPRQGDVDSLRSPEGSRS